MMEDDETLIRKACAAKNGPAFRKLWVGDRSGYPSQSEADLALCSMLQFWTDGDKQRMDRLVRRSGLIRPKWDERHGERTYGQMTIGKAGSGDYQNPLSAPGPDPPEEIHSFPLTDAGNAEWFAHRYGHGLR